MEFLQRKWIFVLLAYLLATPVFADITDSIHAIEAIEIQGSRLRQFHTGASVQEVDSFILSHYSNESVATLLSQQALASVNSYGPGGQSSLSIRGGSSHHSTVVWNSLNLQSPMNGGVNLATLPSCFIDKAYIQYGGSSTLFGSGTTTGSLHLSESIDLNSGPKATFEGMTGNEGNFLHSGKIGISNQKAAANFKYFLQTNNNAFRFENVQKSGKPVETLKHGGYKQYGLAHSNKLQLSSNSWMGATLWWLSLHKDIPALMGDYGESVAEQSDKNLMYSVYYKYASSKIRFKFQSGGFYNQVLYTDSSKFIDNNNHSFTNQQTIELGYIPSARIKLGAIMEYKNERAGSGAYANVYKRHTLSGVISISYVNQKFKSIFTLRNDLIDGTSIPVAIAVGSEYSLTNNLTLLVQLSKNYSLPTFNDLYWQNDGYTMGNPELKPESGWSGEGGLSQQIKSTHSTTHISAVYFSNRITNWIRWLPDNEGVWTPQNIQDALSHGLELNTDYLYRLNKFYIHARLSCTYTNAHVIKSENHLLTNSQQMYYVPKYVAFASTEIEFKHFTTGYNQSYTSSRTYNNAGGMLDAYTLGNLFVQLRFNVKSTKLDIYGKINNIWNMSYQTQKSYAMPLRLFQTGIKITFN